jgi:CHAT domain-containing protein
VLLQYVGKKLVTPEDLQLVQEGETVPVTIWRDGQVLDFKLKPGRLGVNLAKGSAADTVRSTREGDALVAGLTRGPTLARLPGTRREVEAVAGLFPHSQRLLGPDAKQSALCHLACDGSLGMFDVIHLATHGLTDPHVALQSAIILSQGPNDNGKLTAMEMQDWKLSAELVVLSACESGLGRYAGGEGYIGFSQALFLAGARSVVLSLWKVDDTATSLFMARFYQNLLGKRAGLDKPMSKANALKEAKDWLRNLTYEEAEQEVAELGTVSRGLKLEPILLPMSGEKPLDHPYYWSAFILMGDPS